MYLGSSEVDGSRARPPVWPMGVKSSRGDQEGPEGAQQDHRQSGETGSRSRSAQSAKQRTEEGNRAKSVEALESINGKKPRLCWAQRSLLLVIYTLV